MHPRRPDDVLIITKPLGSGIISTAAKADQTDSDHVTAAVTWMKRLNRTASEVADSLGLRAGTDITEFGLLGHAWEMAGASDVSLCLDPDRVPFLDGARRYADEGLFPAGSIVNQQAHAEHVAFGPTVSEEEALLMFDAQTSGGLLLAVPAGRLEEFRGAMAARDEPVWVIGRALAGRPDIWVERETERCV